MKKTLNKKKGFTLIELLAIIVIFGIIIGVSFPIVQTIMNNQDNKKYSYHEKIVEAATNTYIDQYGEDFDPDRECFNIPYYALINEGLVKEEEITCDTNQDPDADGIIQVWRRGDSNNFDYYYYLNCKNKNTGKVYTADKKAPAGCMGVNGNFLITKMTVLYDNATSGQVYSGSLTNRNVYFSIEANDPYMAGFHHVEYSLDEGATWTSTPEGSHEFTLTSSYKGDVYVRAVDKDGNRSSAESQFVNIDKTAPRAQIVFTPDSPQKVPNWFASNVTISYQSTDSDIARVEWSENNLYITSNQKDHVVRLTVTDQAGNSSTVTRTLNIDKTVPTVGQIQVASGTLGSNGWYTSNVTLTNTACSTSGPSGCTSSLSPTSLTASSSSGQTVTLTATSGAGLSSSTSTTIKIDKTGPSTPTSSGIGNGSMTGGSGSTDVESGISHYLYCAKTNSATPSNTDSCFTTSNTFTTSCGQTWYGWVVAVNKAGLRSGVKYHGSYKTADCCTLPAYDSACSTAGQTVWCNGQSRTCTNVGTNILNARWEITMACTLNCITSGGSFRGTWVCGKDSANGDKFNSGGSIGIGVSAYFIINGASLSDYYYYNGVVGNMQATCYYDTSPILRWR